ncbi:MAG: hypothetical protein ACLQVI_04730 [Polyangiaceae bacterium]
MPPATRPMHRALVACLIPALIGSAIPTLTGCAGGAPTVPPATPHATTEPRPDKPTPDAVWVQFQPEDPDQRWSLVASDEKVLCALPCAHWMPPESGAVLQYERPGTTSLLRVGVPGDLGPPGSSAIAVARLGFASKQTSTKLILGGISLAIVGVILYGVLDGRSSDSSTAALASIVAGGSAGALLAGAGLYIRTMSHSADVSVRAAASSRHATFAFGPGLVEATTASPEGPHIVLTPLGAAGTF